MAIPQLVFALLLLTIVGANVVNLILVIALLYSPLVFRLARAVAGNIVVMDYIEAARLRGEKTWYLIVSEILPNATAPLGGGVRAAVLLRVPGHLGPVLPRSRHPTADRGLGLDGARERHPHLVRRGDPADPAAAIALLTVAVNFVVDWMLHLSSGLKE